jgi:hypothetical protein
MEDIITIVLMLLALILWTLFATTKKVKIQYPIMANMLQLSWWMYVAMQ